MAYASVNFKSKKAFKEAVAAGGAVSVNHGLGLAKNSADEKLTGRESVEGPWYPQPHTWYASVQLVDGYVVSVK